MLRSLIAMLLVLICVAAADAATRNERYADLARMRLNAAHDAAVDLQRAVEMLFSEPNDATLESARLAWRHAHNMHVMARPLYLSGRAADEEADVLSGFEAAEHILWGEDEKLDAPGNRPLSEFVTGAPRLAERRKHLTAAVESIMQYVANRRSHLPPAHALPPIIDHLVATATNLARTHIDEPLASRDPQQEPSRYSDNTLEDLRYAIEGMRQVVAALQPQNAERMTELLDRAARSARGIHAHMDYLIAAPADHPERRALEQIAADLHAFAREASAAAAGLGAGRPGAGLTDPRS